MADLQQSIHNLQEIYNQCPQLPCSMCGNCCVSPHMGFVEFAYLLDGFFERLSSDEIRQIFHAVPETSTRMSGHLNCQAIREGVCVVHDYRPLACRLEGIPELAAACGCERDYCPGCDKVPMGQVNGEGLAALVNAACDLNMEYHEYLGDPYYLDALNLHCWVAVCLNPEITQPMFVELRDQLYARHDMGFLREGYVDQTGLKDKLDLIDQFFELNSQQRAGEALDCMQKVLDGFPNTGVYYSDQAKIYISFMKELLGSISEE